jgi:hypothetical protein
MTLPPIFKTYEAIDEAFERIGFDPEGLTARHLASARRSIHLMLDLWNNDSVDFWKVVSGVEQPTSVLMQTFTPAVDGFIDMLRMTLKRDSYTTPITLIAASDWFAIPDKDVTRGMPNRCWVQRLQNSAECYIYPKAENDTDIIIYDAMVRSYDSAILNAQADVPPTWNEAFTAGLTWYLAEKFAPARMAEKDVKYGGPGTSTYAAGKPVGAYAIARMGNRERADTTFVVHKNRRPRR